MDLPRPTDQIVGHALSDPTSPSPQLHPTMPHPLIESVQHVWPTERWQHTNILVGVSGGADSMALLRALQHLGASRLHVGHFNHNWRGIDSHIDCQFVQDCASQWGLPCHTATATQMARDEATARAQRHTFLGHTAEKIGARYLALGHTQDDQTETILHRVLRGTGLRGLSGIPSFRLYSPAVTIVRPLLQTTRATVLDYLSSLAQPYRNDATNTDPAYTRNRIRLELLPLMEQHYNPKVALALLRLAEQAREAQTWISDYAQAWLAPALSMSNSHTVQLNLSQLLLPPNGSEFLLREAITDVWRRQAWPLQAMTAEHWQSLAHWLLAGEPPDCQQYPGGISVRRAASGCYTFVQKSAS